MRQPLIFLLCLIFVNAASGQKPPQAPQALPSQVTPPPKPIPDLRISSMTLTHATISKQPPIVANPNGGQQGPANTTSPNPAVQCTIVLSDDVSEQDSIVLELGIPVGATILQLPSNGTLQTGLAPIRNALVSASPYHMMIGRMKAGQVMTIQFTFATTASPVKVWARATGRYTETLWKNNYGEATL